MISLNNRVRLGVLTSSRADYGIYQPLLSLLNNDNRFDLVIIAYGMHLLDKHGNTLEFIRNDKYKRIDIIEGMPDGDSVENITIGYGELIKNFGSYWAENSYDWVLALGDRFEMSAAVQSGIPFTVNFAHIHGGETTLGAIDNIYRHQISLASKLHFVAADIFKDKLIQLIGCSDKIYNVGALSLDGLEINSLPDWTSVCEKFNIPKKKFILTTFHPETVGFEKNTGFCKILLFTLSKICANFHIVITLANADTMGSLYRDVAKQLKINHPENISVVTSFGKENYFSAMNSCEFLLGNTSSGILEAATFGKYVLNVGDRQKGRLQSDNVINCEFSEGDILMSVQQAVENGRYLGSNKYSQEGTAEKILKILVDETL